MAIATMIGATPKQLETAKSRAIDLCRLAYAPQPVPQPDGSVLRLCWSGRIERGYDKLAIARIAKDEPAIHKIETALAQLQAKATAAFDAAESAKRAWVAMATAAGQTADVDAIYPPTCTCAACTAAAAYRSHHEFRHVYTAVLYELLAPDPVTTPPLLVCLFNLKDKPTQDRFWTMIGRVRDAANAYIQACAAADVQPNWRLAMYPGEGWEVDGKI
jgi:hypothetical protein